MKYVIVPAIALLATLSVGASEHPAETVPPALETVENFRLIAHDDRSHELYHAADARAVVLYIHGVGCPIVRRSVPELNRIHEVYAPQGVQFFMINANSQDSRADLAGEVQEYGITMPVLKDETQRIVHSLGSRRTAEVIVLDPASKWQMIYRGPVDDRFDYGTQKETAENRYLEAVLQAHLAGSPLPAKAAGTKGCLINFLAEEEPISYAAQVAPILQAKCVTCHRDGGVGPFSMNSYRRVRGWSDMIRETLRTHRMPPWHADPEYQEFHNSLDLTVEERRTLLAWVEQGAKQDGESDPLAEVGPAPEAQWTLGTPDLVVQLPAPETLPASGVFDYRYISVPSGLTENQWLRAVEVLPTAVEAVHHALVFIQYPGPYRHLEPDARGGLDGFFASYLPGGNIQPFPEGTAQFVPAGSTFVFQMHYNSTGKEEVDQTRMGLYFNDGPPKEVLRIRAAAKTDFEIPPHARDFATEATYRFREDVTLLGLSPHMHYRGSRFRFDATFADGRQETLLSVPWYQFDWQPMYYFSEPIAVKEGARIHCTGAFDNSAFNPRNPDPTQRVRFGEQSHEEMFIGYVTYSHPYRPEDFAPREENPDGWPGYGKPLTPEYLTGTTWRVGRRFELRFEPAGKLVVNNQIEGEWSQEGQKVQLKTPLRSFALDVVHDGLYVEGRPLTRVTEEKAEGEV